MSLDARRGLTLHLENQERHMNTIEKIIKAHGGLAALQEKHVVVMNPPYQRLVIEHVGRGPRGGELVAVAHTFEQNGDLMYDPEIVFEVLAGAAWEPVEITQHPVGVYRRAVWTDSGRLRSNAALIRELKEFAGLWDRNLREQGFPEAAAS